MQTQKLNTEAQSKVEAMNRNTGKGPSFFEVTYLQQLKDELEVFLRSKNFSTIHQFDIAFAGSDYVGHMKVGA